MAWSYVVLIRKVIETDNRLFIVMDWIEGGTLLNFIKNRAKREQEIEDYEASLIMKGILNGIEYIHN